MKVLASILTAAMLAVGGCSMACHHGGSGHVQEGHDHGEVKVEFNALPVAVQKTLTAEAEGQKISAVEQEVEEGEMGYEADVMLYGRTYEIRVAPDGHLVSKKIDKDDQADGRGDRAMNKRDED